MTTCQEVIDILKVLDVDDISYTYYINYIAENFTIEQISNVVNSNIPVENPENEDHIKLLTIIQRIQDVTSCELRKNSELVRDALNDKVENNPTVPIENWRDENNTPEIPTIGDIERVESREDVYPLPLESLINSHENTETENTKDEEKVM
jgi:hypothetical protein